MATVKSSSWAVLSFRNWRSTYGMCRKRICSLHRQTVRCWRCVPSLYSSILRCLWDYLKLYGYIMNLLSFFIILLPGAQYKSRQSKIFWNWCFSNWVFLDSLYCKFFNQLTFYVKKFSSRPFSMNLAARMD